MMIRRNWWLGIGLAMMVSSLARADVHVLSEAEAPFSLEVISSTEAKVVVRFEIHRFETGTVDIDGEEFSTLVLGGATLTDDWGWPALPKINQDVAIGNGSEPVTARVLEAEEITVKLEPIRPSKGSLLRSVNPREVPYAFSHFYGEQAFSETYPAERVFTSAPFRLRDVAGVTLNLRPFQYQQGTTHLTVAKRMTVELTLAKQNARSDRGVVIDRSKPLNRDFLTLYRKHFLNANWALAATGAGGAASELGTILVLTPGDLAPALEAWIQWKERRGYDVEQMIVAGQSAQADVIKKLISDAYAQNPSIAYVVLVGDHDRLPFHPGTAGNATGNEADPLYGLVAGEDSYPDLIVARLSANTPGEIRSIVSRGVTYERDPEVNASWYGHALAIASDEGYPSSDGERAEELAEILTAGGFDDIVRHYDPGVLADEVTASLNAGVSVVNYIGHGLPTKWLTSGFTNAHVDRLSNSGRLPIVISVACVNGHFRYEDDDAFAERWLKAGSPEQPIGALAMFASSTDQAWIPPTIGQAEIARLVAGGSLRSVGVLMTAGSIAVLEDHDMFSEQTFQTWHVFGDPTVELRTTTPSAVAAVMLGDFAAGRRSARLELGEAGLSAVVLRQGRPLARALSGSDGTALLEFPKPLASGEKLELVVSGADKIPLEREVIVD